MLKRQKGNLELEIVFSSNQEVEDIKKELDMLIRDERKSKGIEYHISRLDIKTNMLVFFLKGEKVKKHVLKTLLRKKAKWIPKKYSIVRCIPEQANVREELEKAREQLERRFGGRYKMSLLLPTIETKNGEILVILLGKLKS